jgi:hypothetical protein
VPILIDSRERSLKEVPTMQRRLRSVLFLAAVGLVGCGSDDSIMLDPSKLQPETEAQIKISKDMDEKINREEGGSYDARKASKPGGGR